MLLQTTVSWDGDSLVCVQKGEKEGRGWTHWLEGDKLHLVSIYNGGGKRRGGGGGGGETKDREVPRTRTSLRRRGHSGLSSPPSREIPARIILMEDAVKQGIRGEEWGGGGLWGAGDR